MKKSKNPTIAFTKVIPLSKEDSGLEHSIVRLENSNMKRYGRRTAVLIRSDKAKSVIRYTMGNNGTLKGLTKNVLALDYDAIVDLDVQYEQPESLTIRKATMLECMVWLNRSPDLNVKISFRLGLLGAALGFVGFAIGIIGLL
jgi:hypothetical protein